MKKCERYNCVCLIFISCTPFHQLKFIHNWPRTLRNLFHRAGKKLPNFQFFASNEVSTCSGCCYGILQLCDVYKGSLGGMNGITIHQYLRTKEQKIALLNSVNFTTSNEPNSHSFELQD